MSKAKPKLSPLKVRKFNREMRQRMIRGEINFRLQIRMLGSKFRLPLRANYEFVPEWPVFDPATGRDMPAEMVRDLVGISLGARKRRTGRWVDIGCVLLEHDLIPPDSMHKLFDAIERAAKRKDAQARAKFAKSRRPSSATVISFQGAHIKLVYHRLLRLDESNAASWKFDLGMAPVGRRGSDRLLGEVGPRANSDGAEQARQIIHGRRFPQQLVLSCSGGLRKRRR